MNPEIIKKQMRSKRNKQLKQQQKHSNLIWMKLMATIILTLSILIGIKQSKTFKKVFYEQKEGYGKTVIIQQMNGVDLWYGGLKEINVKLYDYVEEGSLLGETENQNLFLVFKKEGTTLDYKEYLS